MSHRPKRTLGFPFGEGIMTQYYPAELSQFLEPDEEVIHYSRQEIRGGDVLTNKRLFQYNTRGDGKISDSFAIDTIQSVDFDVLVFGSSSTTACIKLKLTGRSKPEYYPFDPKHESREILPRKLCEVAKLGFAVPKPLYGQAKRGINVSFYLKKDLKWPKLCASCSATSGGFTYDEISKTRLDTYQQGAQIMSLAPIGESQVKLQIPYCQKCYKERFGFLKKKRAVKIETFNGLNVVAWIEYYPYAENFINMNK